MASQTKGRLTDDQKQFWLKHGYLKIPSCFSRETSNAFTSSIWTRLGADPTDKTTWPTEKQNLPAHNQVLAKTFAPKAWSAICELVGGEDKVDESCHYWKDGFIPNFGHPDFKAEDELDFRGLDNWHNDGDFFVHFLDSPEQALLVIPLFSDIEAKGGGTVLCTDGIGLVAQRLYDHPEGCTPFMMPRDTPNIAIGTEERHKIWNGWVRDPSLTSDESFVEATGEVGDVYLLHPFMLHSASRNLLRSVRIITNPPVSIKEPFNYNRSDPSEYSLVEQKTLLDLGRPEGLPEWKLTAPRERLVPERIKIQMALKEKEIERLRAQGNIGTILEGIQPANVDVAAHGQPIKQH